MGKEIDFWSRIIKGQGRERAEIMSLLGDVSRQINQLRCETVKAFREIAKEVDR